MSCKACITFALISIICASIVAAILVVPLIVLPSLADEVHNLYDPVPAACYVQNVVLIRNNTNKCKTFGSCNQGCSNWNGTCEQIVVKYQYKAQREWWEDPASNKDNLTWQTLGNVPLRITAEACGDEPKINCQEFRDHLISLGTNRSFNCYRSLNKNRVVYTYEYEFNDPSYPTWVAITLPLILLFVAAGGTFLLCIRYMRKYRPRNALDLEVVDCSRRHAFE